MSRLLEWLPPKNPGEMTAAELGDALTRIRHIVALQDAYEDEAFRRAMRGQPVTGFKLVHKQVNRQWSEDAAFILAETFGDDAFVITRKLITPAECERRGRHDLAEQFAFKPEPGFTVVPLKDRRERVAAPNTLQ